MTNEDVYGPGTRRTQLAERFLTTRTIVAAVLAVMALILVLQNTGSGRINIYFWDLDLPRWVWLVAMLVTGFIIGSLFPWFRRRS